jgi:hypothetical protein
MNRISKLALTVGAVLLVVVGASAISASQAAHADNVVRANRTQARSGLTGGAALGVGHLGCDSNECDKLVEAGGISAHLGGMLSPRLALVGDLWGMSHKDGRATFSQTILTAALRWWPVDVIWLSGGVGVARASFHYDADFVEFMNRSDTVPGFMAAAGVELLHSSTFALEVQVRAGTGVYDQDERIRNYALSVGASFY